MPSHIFNRLGLWNESIASNLASASVAAAWVKQGRGGLFDELHALNNLEYGYLQLGQYARARDVIDRIDKASSGAAGDPWAGIDARIYFDLEAHDWRDALRLQAPPKSAFRENFDVYWIHSVAAARLGQSEQAKTDLDNFRQASAEWATAHAWTGDMLHLALLEAEAWTQFSQGEHDQALNTLEHAGQFERDHPMYYADILARPSAEMRGDMLLEMKRPAEALRAYKLSLETAPNRFNSIRGAKTSAAETRNSKASDGAKSTEKPCPVLRSSSASSTPPGRSPLTLATKP